MPDTNKTMLGKLLRRAKPIIDIQLAGSNVNDVLWSYMEWPLLQTDLDEAQKKHFAIVMRGLAKLSTSEYAQKIGL